MYEWRLDKSRVADVTAGEKILARLPRNAGVVSMDGAYDARRIYEIVEQNGAKPIIKSRKNARAGTVNARGRAIRFQRRRQAAWQRMYNRRPITESVNYAIKRRFGDRLWTRGMWAQRNEIALRILVYNTALLGRWFTRMRYHGRPS